MNEEGKRISQTERFNEGNENDTENKVWERELKKNYLVPVENIKKSSFC